ncbi:unnamed protein product [Soboliphyme baturini]|uniref:DUF4821 domain-containing protein n=1 Tax=Soboliphyme baturini TaxID=241478 RepID=A0A183J7I0_9BILA|nr:unnamed protein product [Soboliphyme baturini]
MGTNRVTGNTMPFRHASDQYESSGQEPAEPEADDNVNTDSSCDDHSDYDQSTGDRSIHDIVPADDHVTSDFEIGRRSASICTYINFAAVQHEIAEFRVTGGGAGDRANGELAATGGAADDHANSEYGTNDHAVTDTSTAQHAESDSATDVHTAFESALADRVVVNNTADDGLSVDDHDKVDSDAGDGMPVNLTPTMSASGRAADGHLIRLPVADDSLAKTLMLFENIVNARSNCAEVFMVFLDRPGEGTLAKYSGFEDDGIDDLKSGLSMVYELKVSASSPHVVFGLLLYDEDLKSVSLLPSPELCDESSIIDQFIDVTSMKRSTDWIPMDEIILQS